MSGLAGHDGVCDWRCPALRPAFARTMLRWRGTIVQAGSEGKAVIGLLLIELGLLIASGLDKHLEAVFVAGSPAWLTELTPLFSPR